MKGRRWMTEAAKREARLWGYLWNLRKGERHRWPVCFVPQRYRRITRGKAFVL